MKIVVTGATGFVGVPLVRQLLDHGHEVVALTRNPFKAAPKLPARCVCIAWKPPQQPLPATALEGCDAIIHLAGEGVADKSWSEQRKREIINSRVDSTRALISALRAMPADARPKAFIGASAIGFYGDRGDEILNEDSRRGEGFLADVCAAWEQESSVARTLGLRTPLIRIGLVLGKDGGALAKMLPPFQLGVGGRLGAGSQWMSWIHLDDLVGLFVQAVENDSYDGVINGVAPQVATNAEFTNSLGRAVQRPTLLPVPRFALNLAVGEMSSMLLASQRILPKRVQDLGFSFRYPHLDEALEEIADGVHELHAEQWVKRPLAEVFDFFSDAHNLEKLTPPFLHFQVLSTSTPAMSEGMLINYKLSLHGLPMRWQSRIETWKPGQHFVDTQVTGPYRLWHHTHEFEAYEGGTIVRDHVRYQLPLGGFGDALAGPLVKRDIGKIFDFRRQQVEEIFA